MKLKITSLGKTDDENIAQLTLVAETETHKTTLVFWANFDTFDRFADSLEQFPFESHDDVTYSFGYDGTPNNSQIPDKLMLKARLIDSAGHISIRIETAVMPSKEDRSQDIVSSFSDNIEAASLMKLGTKLKNINLSVQSELVWDSSEV